MRNYIKNLLYLHDCVVIPDFGGFVTGYQSSEIHKFRNLVYPPSKSIMFNRRLQANDGILINHVAQQEKTDYRKAEEKVKQFSAWWNRTLESKGVVVFPDVGKLYINSANVLIFLPELRKNYLLDTFGLKPIAFHPQMEVVSPGKQKEKIPEPLSEDEYAERLRIKRIRRTQLAAAAVLTGILLLIPQLFLQNYLPEKIRIKQLNILDVANSGGGIQALKENAKIEDLKKEEAVEEVAKEKLPEKTSEEKENIPATSTIAPPADESESSFSEEEKAMEKSDGGGNYYIIFGSFDFISDAIRMKKELDARFGKTLEVFSSEDGTYLAGIFSGTKESAEASLRTFDSSDLKPKVIAKESPR